jgi:integrase
MFMALTELAIKGFKPQEKPYRKPDGGGLCLEITPAGGKLWRLRYYFQGRAQMMALGKYPAVGLAEARKRRDEARQYLEGGRNPIREKQAQKLRQAQEGENTFEKMARAWLALKGTNLNQKYHKQSLERMEQHVFPMIGALPITEITTLAVVRVIEKIASRGTIETARRMGQLIGQTFRYACRRDLCKYNPASDLRDILKLPEKKHHARVPLEELPELLQSIANRENDLSKAAMQLLSLTLLRTNELIGAKWSEIQWGHAEWHVPKERMKIKRPHIVPLSRQTIEILKSLQKETGDKEFIFHSYASQSKHISNGTVLMALRRMGYQGRMTGHGFRSIASTILNEKGYRPDAIERQLAHADKDKVRSAYNHAEYLLERKKMMQDYADMLEKIKDAKAGQNILSIKNRAA